MVSRAVTVNFMNGLEKPIKKISICYKKKWLVFIFNFLWFNLEGFSSTDFRHFITDGHLQ
jgi:hypothetical protein